jgi:hypothetical protein
MSLTRGRRLGLSLPRRFVCDLLHFAKKIPSIPMQKRMRLAELVAARKAWPQRVSWCVIFLKAYATVAASRPELRRAYVPIPWPHLYEHSGNIASVGIERTYQGEPGVFFGQIHEPERLPLTELDARLRHFKNEPIEQNARYRQALLLSRLPLPLRRFVWWLGLSASGFYRALFFGTFGISVVASFGAAGLHILSPLSTTLNYGEFEPDGSLDVRIAYDHRVLDGATMARAMADLEDVLVGPILAELRAGAPWVVQQVPAELQEQIADVTPRLATAAVPFSVNLAVPQAVASSSTFDGALVQ